MHLSIPVGVWKYRMSWICLKGHNTRVVTLVIWEAGDSWHGGLKKKNIEEKREREKSLCFNCCYSALCKKECNLPQKWVNFDIEWNGVASSYFTTKKCTFVQILKKVFNRKIIMQKRVSFGVWFKSSQIIVFGAKIVTNFEELLTTFQVN